MDSKELISRAKGIIHTFTKETSLFPKPRLEKLNSFFDHTLLSPSAGASEIKRLCEEAKRYGFYSVCVNPYWVSVARGELQKTDVRVTTVVGFPLGANSPKTKCEEAKVAIWEGADEIDMVQNIGLIKSLEFEAVSDEIRLIKETIGSNTLKLIIETAYLTDIEKVISCLLAKEAGADFVKTSTGFAKTGATVYDVALMRHAVGERVGVKAAGGIRTLADAIAMIQAGATRLGASSSVKIIEETKTL
ncbi:deoxyribose-phosphate aldolase [bacterium]|nr:deoxyribose-phosphate aldolase [bacterium]